MLKQKSIQKTLPTQNVSAEEMSNAVGGIRGVMHVAAFSACEEFGGGGGGGGSWIDQALDWVHRQLESSCYDLPDWGDKSLKETYFDWDCFLEKNFKAWEKLPTSYPPSGYH